MSADETPPTRLEDLDAGTPFDPADPTASLRAAQTVAEDEKVLAAGNAVRAMAEARVLDAVIKATVKDYVVRHKLLPPAAFEAIVRESSPRPQKPAPKQPPKQRDDDREIRAAFMALGGELTGSELLDEICGELKKFVVFPCDEAADAAVLFAAATHAQPELQFAPRFSIRSPVKRCGKSRLFDLMALLSHGPLITVDISPAALVHAITEHDPPTIMLDEADATFSKALKQDEKAEHLRGILNAGFDRGRPYIRHDYASRQNEACPTFAMAVLAGIGRLPDTIEDRSVIVTLQRKAPGEKVQKYRIRRHKPTFQKLGAHLRNWVAPLAAKAGAAEPEMPDGLNDRAEDTWEALIAVADLAGDTWPDRARRAAQVLTGQAEERGGLSLRLLADLRTVFGDKVKLHTKTILTELAKLPESPWRDYYGKPLTDRELAGLLSDYQVKSCQVKIDGINNQGYKREDLWDAWNRYLSPAEQKTPEQLRTEAARLRVAAEELEAEAEKLAVGGVGPTSPTNPTAQVSPVDLVNSQTLLPLPGRGGRAEPDTSPTGLSSNVGEVGEVGDTLRHEVPHASPMRWRTDGVPAIGDTGNGEDPAA